MASINSMFDHVEPAPDTTSDPSAIFDKVEPAQAATASGGPDASDAYSFFGVKRGDLPGLFQSAGDFLQGGNQALADQLGSTMDAPAAAINFLHEHGLLSKGLDPHAALMQSLKAIGYPISNIDNLSSKIGAGTIHALEATAALMGGSVGGAGNAAEEAIASFAPKLPAILQDLLGAGKAAGTAALKHPEAAVATDIGSSIGSGLGSEGGQKLGNAVGGDTGGKIGETLGSLAGGLAGGGVTMAGQLAGRVGGHGIALRLAPDEYAAGLGPNEGVVGVPRLNNTNPTADTEAIGTALSADKAKVNGLIASAVKKFGAPGQTMTDTSERLRSYLRGPVLTNARKIENQKWNDSGFKSLPVQTVDIKSQAKAAFEDVQKNLSFTRKTTVPTEAIADIRKLGKMSDIKTVMQIRSAILSASRDQNTPDGMRGALKQLGSTILDTVSKQYPENADIAAAREYSKWLHEKFDGGPVGRFIQRKTPEALLPDELVAGRQLMRASRAGQTLADIQARAESPEVQKYVKTWTSSALQDLAAEKGPEAAYKMQQSPAFQNIVKEMPAHAAKLGAAADDLKAAMDNEALGNRNAYMKLFEADPDAAAASLLKNSDKRRMTADLVSRLEGHPEAKKALGVSLTEQLFKGGRTDEEVMKLLNEPSTRAVYEQVLGSGPFSKLQGDLRNMLKYSEGGNGIANAGRQFLGKAGRLIGVLTPGIHASHGGQLVIAQMKANAGEAIARSFVPTLDKAKILYNAANDDTWRKFLYSRVPENRVDVAHKYVMMRRLTNYVDAASNTRGDKK